MKMLARKSWLLLLGSLFLAACGGGGSLDGSTGNDGGGTPTNPIAPVPVITVDLSFWDCPDPNANSIDGCTSTDSLSIGNPAVVYVQIGNSGEGASIDRQLVTVSSDKGVLSPEDGKVLTNSSGEAFLRMLAGSDEGLATITASYESAQASEFLSIGSANVELALSTTLAAGDELADGATIAVTADVTSDGEPFQTPVVVNFTSACTQQDKATIDSQVTAVGGVATATYRVVGCVAQDTISASVTVGANSATDAVTIQIAEATAAGIEYLSATPEYINLQGSGGATVSEVIFVVNDESGKPLQGADVNFTLFTGAGGTSIPTEKLTARSDAEGKVRTTVVAGTIPGSARVQASLTNTNGTVFTTVSGRLSIGSGFPTIDSFSLSFSEFNPLAWAIDGVEVEVTIRAADHFGNPVPDGFSISFMAEGGAIEPSCQTVAGVCSVKWTSQDFRPDDGRVNVIAFAQGEESFTDMNGDGLFNGQTEFFIDMNVNGVYDAGIDRIPDLPEAFIDSNEDGVRGPSEEFVDYNSDTLYQSANGMFNGLLCNGVDCSSDLLDIYDQGTIQMAGRGTPSAFICGDASCTLANSASFGSGGSVRLCIFEEFTTIEGGVMRTPMAFGTTVAYKGNDPVKIVGGSSDSQLNTSAVVHADASGVIVPARDINTLGCPGSAIFDFGYSEVGTVEVTATYSDGQNFFWIVPVQ